MAIFYKTPEARCLSLNPPESYILFNALQEQAATRGCLVDLTGPSPEKWIEEVRRNPVPIRIEIDLSSEKGQKFLQLFEALGITPENSRVFF